MHNPHTMEEIQLVHLLTHQHVNQGNDVDLDESYLRNATKGILNGRMDGLAPLILCIIFEWI